MEIYPLGESCLCWSLGDTIDAGVSAQILGVYRNLKSRSPEKRGILDLVPSYNALAVHFNPVVTDPEELKILVDEAFACSRKSVTSGKSLEIAVKYDGVDLARVAGIHNMTEREVIDLHKRSTFTVAMVGFLPHFPYLIGLDERLATPRLDSPRVKVPAGAVAIGGAQTGIYPAESPGGWNLIGSTDPGLLKHIEPGDTVILKEID